MRDLCKKPTFRAMVAPRVITAAVLFTSFFTVLGCSQALQNRSEGAPRVSAFAGKGPMTNPSLARTTCSFSNGTLTYLRGQVQESITLDVDVRNPGRTICSDLFTVIMTPSKAVIAVGANKVLNDDGTERMLGMIGDQYVAANSYSINIDWAVAEGITDVRLERAELHLRTRRATWVLDLTNPVEWTSH